MSKMDDIKIILEFEPKSIPAGLVAECIEGVEAAVYDSEISELDRIQSMMKGIPPSIFDAVRYRMPQYRRQSFLIETAYGGSTILACVISGIAIWLLKITLGETIKDAWKESGFHKKLKEILVSGNKEKVEDIAKRIEHRIIRKTGSFKTFEIYLKVEVKTSQKPFAIIVRVGFSSRTKLPPTRGEIINGD